ncbi:MAG: type II secretion system protein [bacterium]|nr:type II secretion system protein [bacterium]
MNYDTLKNEAIVTIKMRKGFTLIEILIVTAIIALLASSVLIGFAPAQRQGRDARRIADLRQVQNALEIYYSKCGYYPGSAQAGAPCGNFTQISTWGALSTALTGSSIGVYKVPNDPSSGKTYFYGTDNIGSSYVIAASLEDTNSSALRSGATGNIFGVNCAGNIYCIQF